MDETNDQNFDGTAAAPVTSDNVEVPDDRRSPGWKMPEPVFQKTSGYLPKGFDKRVGADRVNGDAAAGAGMPVAPAAAAPAIEVQPQPDVILDLPPPVAAAPPVKPKRSKEMTLLLTLLGIGAMIAFAVVFVLVILYLFFSPERISVFN